ncbi:MAG: glycopeptide resistance accessory protein VanW [Blautia sp.]|nr:glycopeptide resistance accessory protein VanW [Lachnoclostridium sp.]MCM1211697.1 glycopeptide resistance accessory protein VanW [Blautia sp.]
MARKRITQRFPWLLPFRRWQRKKMFYLFMRLDKNRYAKEKAAYPLPYELFSTASLMRNPDSGFAMQYQENKVYNLHLAAETINHIIIRPGETFSFWQLVRYADSSRPYKDGLTFVDGKITGAYGGGLCQLSNLLFWLFLHIPVEIVERHGHEEESFPPADKALPYGVDATVYEGWKDLKVKNTTEHLFQIVITFDEDYMYGSIRSDEEAAYRYEIYNREVSYYRKQGKLYREVSVDGVREDKAGYREEISFYRTVCEIGYPLPEDIG